MLRALAAAIVLLTGAGTAHAQEATAVLHVRVLIAPSITMGVATVGVHEAGRNDRYWSAAVTRDQSATFRGLAPGSYRITADVPGGGTAVSDVQLEAGEAVWIRATIVPAKVGESKLELVDRDRGAEGTDFRAEQLQDLPNGRDLWALIDAAAPYLIADRSNAGGLGAGQSALVGSRGASFTTNSIAFGNLTIPNPERHGVFPFLPDLHAAEAVLLSTGMLTPENAAPGTAIALAPKRPGDRLAGSVQAAFTGGGMVADNAKPGAPSIARLDRWSEVAVQVGGPIRERAGLFVSNTFTASKQQERDRAFKPSPVVDALFAHLIVRPTDRDELRVIGGLQQISRAFDDRRQFAVDGTTERDRFVQTQATWEQLGASGDRQQASFGWQRGSFTPRLGAVTGGTMDRVFDGIIPPAPSAIVYTRLTGQFELQPHDQHAIGFDHNMRGGLQVLRSTESLDVLAAPPVAEMVGGVPARVWIDTQPAVTSHRRVNELTGFVTDRMSRSGLTLDAGLRLSAAFGKAQDGAKVSWKTLAPRLTFRWNPGPLIVFGGYARYQPHLPVDLLAYGDPGEPGALVYLWNDANGDRVFQPSEQGTLVARAGHGQGTGSIDGSLRAPVTREVTFGAECRITDEQRLRGAFVFRRETRLLGSANTGVPLSSYQALQVPDQGEDYNSPNDDRLLTIYDRSPSSFGQDKYLLTNPAGAVATYEGVEVTWEMRSKEWYALVGAMAYKTRARGGDRGFGALENDQGVVGELYENPNAQSFGPGSDFFDRSYVLKWSTAYRAPHDVHVAVTARYQDGTPFARVVVAQGLSQGAEMVEAYRTGRTRYTFALTVDMRVEKGLKLGSRRGAIQFDIYNLSNTAHEVEENPITGAAFRNSTAVQPPRTIRLGFRVEF